MNAEDIKRQLIERGAVLNPSAPRSQIVVLEKRLGRRLSPALTEMFLSFDGHLDGDFDSRSEIAIRSIERLLTSPEEEFAGQRVPFADFSLDAEIITCSLAEPEGPILTLFSKRELAGSLSRFWGKLSSGEFDLVSHR
jgi:hypothetical protein